MVRTGHGVDARYVELLKHSSRGQSSDAAEKSAVPAINKQAIVRDQISFGVRFVHVNYNESPDEVPS